MEKEKQIDTENIDPRYIKKDGTLAPLKKDGSLRLVGGGYSTKQEKWGKKVLRNASKIAKEMFGYFDKIVVAHYLRYDCGYEGAVHIFAKKETYKKYQSLVAAFDNLPFYIRRKYKDYKEVVFETNFAEFIKHRRKKKDN